MRQEESLEQVIKPAVESCGYVLWGLEYLPRKSSGLLRVYIDHENGIVIKDCEAASKQISYVLDVEDPLSGAYDLEVSSPGLDRKFFDIEQYEAYIDQDILVKLWAPVQNKKKFQAKLVKVDVENEKLSFSFKDSVQKDLASLDNVDLSLSQIKQANLFIDDKIFSK
jgi:ribosome maturation factor RimP